MTRNSKSPPFRTNPSAIARYFFHDCERFLYYSSATPSQRKKEKLPSPTFDRSPLIELILQSGYQWEEEVVQDILEGQVVVAAGTGDLSSRRLGWKQTVQCLRKEPPGRYLYQPTLSIPDRFYERYDLDQKLVRISDNHPDLIQITHAENGSRLFRILDLKRGDSLKLTHRVQILLYALELQAVIESLEIPEAVADLSQGGVWLGQHPEPSLFPLKDFRPHLEQFLREDLMGILGGKAEEARWHLYPRCEWCEFFEHCREEMHERDDVSRLAQLTTYGKRHLQEEAGVESLTQLIRFLHRGDADEVLSRCASLAGQRHRLAKRVEALQKNEIRLQGSSATALPRGENIALFVTLQVEPLSHETYLFGAYLQGRAEVLEALFTDPGECSFNLNNGKALPAVWLANRPEAPPESRRDFIRAIADLFQRLHRYNIEAPEWSSQLTLQVYVLSEEEREALYECLLLSLKEGTVTEEVLTLLFHFQGPELLQAQKHPAQEVPYPVVVLNQAVSELLALPVEVSYTLPEMLEAMGSEFVYSRRDFFHFPHGNGFRAEAIHSAWYHGRREQLSEIQAQATLYLRAVAALLRSLRECAGNYLSTWPPKFTLPIGEQIDHPLLSRLIYFSRYESLLKCMAIREIRSEARQTQVLLGQVIELQAITEVEMEVLSDLPVEPEANGFPAWLLVTSSEEGRQALLDHSDYRYRSARGGGPAQEHRAVVGIEDIRDGSSGRPVLWLHYTKNFKKRPVKPGERFLLYPRFTDFTTDRTVTFLTDLDRSCRPGGRRKKVQQHLFLTLLEDPEATATRLPLPPTVAAIVRSLTSRLQLTRSQQAAFDTICRQRVTAVWGPPGTGKTHFLATMIVGLADAYAQSGMPFRVLVTAFTHAAIENLLKKVVQQQRATKMASHCSIGKAKSWQGPSGRIEVVSEAEIPEWLHFSSSAVLGATVFTCLKKREELEPFDLVVIDEASQIRAPDAAIAVHLVSPEGRLVLAGDHRQLPPIVAGEYPDSSEADPPLHRSIFELVARASTTESKVFRALEENFRMCDTLTSISSKLLYGPGYRCFDNGIAKRRLRLKQRKEDELVQACIDPDFPMVIVILDGVRAARANPVEADLVAQIVTALRQSMLSPTGQLYNSDEEFFRDGVFIVSPHHAQIQAVQRELARHREWHHKPFVSTVDKMQGQESEAVVVSYGVSDPEFALQEAEFIYGLNRLNVAITRARSKCILCLPRPLIDATPQVLEVEEAAVGLGYMRDLVAIVTQQGEVLSFEAEDFEAEVIRM